MFHGECPSSASGLLSLRQTDKTLLATRFVTVYSANIPCLQVRVVLTQDSSSESMLLHVHRHPAGAIARAREYLKMIEGPGKRLGKCKQPGETSLSTEILSYR